MANTMQVVQDPRIHGGSQRNGLKYKKPIGARTGDAVSDESDGDDEADSSANEEDDDDDVEEPDVFALSGSVSARQTGLVSKNVGMIDKNAQATGGAEDEDSNESEEEDDYGAIDEISDSEVSDGGGCGRGVFEFRICPRHV